MDWDEYNEEKRKLKHKRADEAFEQFNEARALAKEHSLDLRRHSMWHYSLTCYKNGERHWRFNIYPSNQLLWHDPKCGKAPYLNLQRDWNLIDVVNEAVR